ncbi:MAG: hypothetical protein KDA86_19750 [Planctomycetaceae bacterium]|nr:hypothetical protein [Planctomycetaceae bacterium]
MSADEPQVSGSSSTVESKDRARKVGIVLLCVILAGFAAIEGVSLVEAQRTENLRREVGIAGGKCQFENRTPTILKRVLGESAPSFMDYPVIVGVTMSGEKISDENLAKLPALPDLMSLDLEGSQVTSDGLDAVSPLKSIRSLSLKDTPVTDITPLADMPHLEILELNFSRCRGEYLSGLSQLKNVTALLAGYLQVTDQEVIEIAKCSQLEELSIAASALGEHGLQPLTSLQKLRTLVLSDARFDSADLEAFKVARPDVEIIR